MEVFFSIMHGSGRSCRHSSLSSTIVTVFDCHASFVQLAVAACFVFALQLHSCESRILQPFSQAWLWSAISSDLSGAQTASCSHCERLGVSQFLLWSWQTSLDSQLQSCVATDGTSVIISGSLRSCVLHGHGHRDNVATQAHHRQGFKRKVILTLGNFGYGLSWINSMATFILQSFNRILLLKIDDITGCGDC